MPAIAHPFPNLQPASRVYTPGIYPTNEFQSLNGSVTTIQYGGRKVDSALKMTFRNITDEQAMEIYQNYEYSMNGRDETTGERDYVLLPKEGGAVAGIKDKTLREIIAERKPTVDLRYRYAKPPEITSTFPGRCTVSVELRGYLDGV